MKVTLGFSACPNDTFIFDALVNNKIDTQGICFDVILEDVETLNRLALKEVLDITKISYGVLPLILKNYIVLNSGSALGTGVGPLLISPLQTTVDVGDVENFTDIENYINNCLIAIPGEHTTAHLLFNTAFPIAKNKIFMRYNEIEDFLLKNNSKFSTTEKDEIHFGSERAIAGVIIHENRFTYEQKGLKKILDLGEYWEKTTNLTIPLGGIVAKRNIDVEILKKVNTLIKKSIEFAFSNYPFVSDYVKHHSQEMEEDIMRKHIDLYVNKYSIQLGIEGQNAIKRFLEIYNTNHSTFEPSTIEIFI